MDYPIDFFVPCNPPKTTAQQKGAFAMPGGGVRFYEKAKVVSAREQLAAHLRPYVPPAPMGGPLNMSIQFVWPWRKSEKKSDVMAFFKMPMYTKPDCSNIVKMIEDVMTGLRFWVDDAQIACLQVSKAWGHNPGISVRVGPIVRELAEPGGAFALRWRGLP